jgi:serine/threonine protein kinase
VYKSIRRLDGCAYAVKRLAHRVRSERDRSRVLREAYASAALADCPKLVRYHDAWIDDGHLHIQTELCPGGCLDRLVFPADYRTQVGPQSIKYFKGKQIQRAERVGGIEPSGQSPSPACA